MSRRADRQRWSILLPEDVPAARTARMALEQWLHDTDRPTTAAVSNIVTELVPNAVRFGRPPVQLSVERHATWLRIEVADARTGTPQAEHAEAWPSTR